MSAGEARPAEYASPNPCPARPFRQSRDLEPPYSKTAHGHSSSAGSGYQTRNRSNCPARSNSPKCSSA